MMPRQPLDSETILYGTTPSRKVVPSLVTYRVHHIRWAQGWRVTLQPEIAGWVPSDDDEHLDVADFASAINTATRMVEASGGGFVEVWGKDGTVFHTRRRVSVPTC